MSGMGHLKKRAVLHLRGHESQLHRRRGFTVSPAEVVLLGHLDGSNTPFFMGRQQGALTWPMDLTRYVVQPGLRPEIAAGRERCFC